MPTTTTRPTAALPDATAALLDNIRCQLANEQPDWRSSQMQEVHIACDRYYDPGIWQAEQQHLFRALPLVVAHSSEIAPGQVLAHDSYGLPLLLSRDTEGVLRCFLNVCRHRGMRLLDATGSAQAAGSVVCPYHGWAYRLDGQLRHMLHAEAFDPCPAGDRNLTPLPCTERHGLVWVIPQVKPGASQDIDLASFLGGLDAELPFYGIENLRHFRTIEADYPANWKLIIDAFLESYHIRVLHKVTIYPFFTDGIVSAAYFGPHIHSLVARRAAQEWFMQPQGKLPGTPDALGRLVTTSQTIFPNTVTIFHPDYLSLITLYPTSAETLHWTHRMLVPADKMTPDWAEHWEKTFHLIEKGVFQKEDIHCAIGIQQGIKTGANTHSTVGRMEQGVAHFHAQVRQAIGQ